MDGDDPANICAHGRRKLFFQGRANGFFQVVAKSFYPGGQQS